MKRLEPIAAIQAPPEKRRQSSRAKEIIADAISIPAGQFVPWECETPQQAKSLVASLRYKKCMARRRENVIYVPTGPLSEKA